MKLPLGLKHSIKQWKATPFKELAPDYTTDMPEIEIATNKEVLDLDFSNFDIDDNCYVYHIEKGSKKVLSEFKTELKL